MGMRWRAKAGSEGVRQTVRHEGRTLKDPSPAASRTHTEGCEGRGKKNRGPSKLIVACITYCQSLPPTVPASQSMGLCCDVCDQRFMGVRVPQCLATVALNLLLLIIKDCCRTHSLCLCLSASVSLLLLCYLLQSQFANGCSNLVIYCCQRYASSKMY